jgi:hypothetical protein
LAAYVLVSLLLAAPAGVGVGLWLAVGAGVGVTAGSALYGAVAAWLLSADVAPREVAR